MTLRVRLLLLVVATVAAGLVISDVVTYNALRSFLTTRVDQQLEVAAYPVGRALLSTSGLGPEVPAAPPLHTSTGTVAGTHGTGATGAHPQTAPRSGAVFRNGGGLFANSNDRGVLVPPGTYGQLRSSDGKIEAHLLFSYGGKTSPAPSLPAKLPGAGLPAGADLYFTASGTGSGAASYRVVAKPLRNDAGVVVIAVPLTDLESTLSQLLVIEIVVSILVLAGLAVLSWVMVRRDLRPLDEITETAGAIAQGDLTQRVTRIDEGTEVGQLGTAFNTMVDEIEAALAERAASEERLRRFLADASHELRTPLTSILGYSELFDLGVRNRPDDLETAIRHIRDEASRMGALVDDLFLLAQLDHERPLRREHVDLTEIARSSVEAVAVSAPGRVIEVVATGPVPCEGDPNRLRQVVDNLVVNALTHSTQGPVLVATSTEGGHPVLTVHDEGPGIDPADLSAIFEPFFRSDPSRARSSGGAGLGLAIVAAIVRAHDGTVTARPGPGATFVVELPPAPIAAAALGDGDAHPRTERDQAEREVLSSEAPGRPGNGTPRAEGPPTGAPGEDLSASSPRGG